MKKRYISFILLFFIMSLSAYNADVSYSDSWEKHGLTIDEQNTNSLKLNYSINNFKFDEMMIESENLTNIHLPGVFLPNDEGMPNLPGMSKYVAIPQGAEVKLNIIDYRVESYLDIDIAPAPRIPLETEDGPLEHKKNSKIYSTNAYYPKNFVQLSKPGKLRGVDVVMLGVTPFQYNPVTKELLIYRDIKIEVEFVGGNGHFGEDRLRSKYWESILHDMVINNTSLPEIDFSQQIEHTRDGEGEYIIITLDDPDFLSYAQTIAEFRRKQGISTCIHTLSEIGGNTETAIETFVDNAYNTWDPAPAAVLLLGDYGTGTSGIESHWYVHPAGYPDFVSDNKFADVNNDELPDIAFARMTANDVAQLEVLVSKGIDYETNPPTNFDFYNKPITALGWQTERWFQICSEVVGGYWTNVKGKAPVRINAIYSGTPGTDWSTATNTSTVVNYFNESSGLGYIPDTPAELGGWSGGTATDVVNAINDGAFMLQHRDHGSYSGWGEPAFQSSNIDALTNTGNELPYILSINCQTGAFHNTSESFAEKFHRHTYDGQNSGAVGILAATEVSYSFVNDTFVWGMFDNFHPDFMPAYGTQFPVDFVYPAFANAAGKHFLSQSSWPYNTGDKLITYRLFHHHGDAFLNVYTEVPQDLTVTCADVHLFGTGTFDVNVDDGASIAITYFDEVNQETVILGTETSSGGATSISISDCPSPGTDLLVTITKQNYFRYTKVVPVITPSGPYLVQNGYTIDDGNNEEADYGETFNIDLIIKNVGTATSSGPTATISTTDPYVISLTNATNVSYPDLAPDASETSSEQFTVELADNIPDQYPIQFDLVLADTYIETIYDITHVFIPVNAPDLTSDNMIIDDTGSLVDENGRLDPGETVILRIPTNNEGHADSPSAYGTISCTSGYITIIDGTHDFGFINTGTTEDAIFEISVDAGTPIGSSVTFEYAVDAGGYYDVNESIGRSVGLILEDFETGNFTSFNWPWTHTGDVYWSADDLEAPYEGTYCAKSGIITHSQTSELILTADVTAAGDISFYRKVSSESSYDYLRFYINDAEQEAWSGELGWEIATYPVVVGNDVEFKWVYSKDTSVDTGSDCAWIDYVIFPSLGAPQPAFTLTPASLEYGLVETGTSSTMQFTISNTGGANLTGSIETPTGYEVSVATENTTLNSKHTKIESITDNNIPYSIPGTSEQIFDLVFTPIDFITYSGNVVITSDDPDHPYTDLSVTGTGAAPADISVTPSSLDYGDVTIGTNSTMQFSIENTGDADLIGSIVTSTDFTVAELAETNERNRITDNSINFNIAGSNSVVYELTFSPTVLGSYSDDVTITHNAAGGTTLLPITGNSVSNIVFPYFVDFENTGSIPSEWTNAGDDDFDWTLLTGATGSTGTGPSGDHTTGSGYYIYTESSSPNYPTMRADLLTPYFDLDAISAPYTSFWYHMYGDTMGELHIDLFDGSVWQEDIIPAINGDQGDQWFEKLIDLSTFTGSVQIRFRGITSSSFTSDMAIDDFWIGDYNPPEININPLSLTETLSEGQSSAQNLQIENIGSGILEYTASLSFTSRAMDDEYIAGSTRSSSQKSKAGNSQDNKTHSNIKVSYKQKQHLDRVLDYMIIGAGNSISTSTNDTPFGTYYEDGQNQYLFTATELYDAGLVTGDITTVGWNVVSATTQEMEGFNIEMKHTTSSSVTGFETGFANHYSGTWTAATGWNDIPFSTPFNWDGTSNLLVKICFDDTFYTSNSSCYIDTYTALNGYAYNDGTAGCTDAYEGTINTRPQTRFTGNTLHWLNIDDGSSVSGFLNPGSTEDLSIGFDTVPDGLTEGVYQANITIVSNDVDEPSIIVPVTLTVLGQLDPPTNVQIAIVGNEITLTWDVVPGATSYTVYRSSDPFAEFPGVWVSETGITEPTWSYTTTKTRRFYRITAE